MIFLYVNAENRTLTYGEKTVSFTEKEFLMLTYLLERRDESNIPTKHIIEHVWKGRANAIGKNNVAQLLYSLRKKLSSFDCDINISISINNGGKCRLNRSTIPVYKKKNKINHFFVKFLLMVMR
ncbi:hypothetical protein GPY51_24215 [Photorhabdus laumondii subsp. laumondii]|uniref:Photorhabdus luminescens subsp. laumondii TTO1 complete genome segment 15/17 n=2 Tax=Photorhabdus laumondii subsp. laumondii TaxID=141679 RepID=Q7MZ58_PHOLL|nr:MULTISPECIES: winged helix-turn-helix domain-containing protein [Photorhabdus]RAW74560.1 hypothetical protein CKY14_06050 [Photorhabdus sp. S14-60]AWK43977.1 hypothetical protein A4R40_22000 [Photorhabdus laumondii subsp. laumondii]AXG44657.1 hypothetical protein PluDJC_21980 [Photorhabdus laumondii subsp. laumondii]AXG49293.1 hypothetical protein PluTT01m_22690 [Photorhabdus laumondii subsp. laumondii]KTL62233.1 hypothetical protein AA106_21130 [Photorhabdus laumondii subsp. laumondii]